MAQALKEKLADKLIKCNAELKKLKGYSKTIYGETKTNLLEDINKIESKKNSLESKLRRLQSKNFENDDDDSIYDQEWNEVESDINNVIARFYR